jgi:hypothetical protein
MGGKKGAPGTNSQPVLVVFINSNQQFLSIRFLTNVAAGRLCSIMAGKPDPAAMLSFAELDVDHRWWWGIWTDDVFGVETPNQVKSVQWQISPSCTGPWHCKLIQGIQPSWELRAGLLVLDT